MTTFTGHLTDAQAQRLVDGALLEAEASEVRAHAGACLECQGLVESYRILGAALDDLALPPLPADFTESVIARIDAEELAVRRERRDAFAIFGGVLAALVAVAALAGAGTWAPAASRLVAELGAAGRALRIGAEVLPPVVAALRIHIALLCLVVVLPVLFALSRLMPSPRTEIA
jgi:anti-sigma factor RsiW